MSNVDMLLEQLEISINGAARDIGECDKAFIHIGRATYLLSLLSMELESEMAALAQYRKAEEEGRLVRLPTPIGAPVYTVCRYLETDGSPVQCVDELHLSGYIKEGEREFYTTYDEGYGTCDVETGDLYATRAEAEQALAARGAKC